MGRILLADPSGALAPRMAMSLAAAGHVVRYVGPDVDAEATLGRHSWPQTTQGWPKPLSDIDTMLLVGPVSYPVCPEGALECLPEAIAAADRAGLSRLVLLSSAAIYSPQAREVATLDDDAPLVSAGEANAEERAWLAAEEAFSKAGQIQEKVILRSDLVLTADHPETRGMVYDALSGYRRTWPNTRLQGVDADELADLAARACSAVAAAGKCLNIAGPVALPADVALAEIARLADILSDDTLPSAPRRPNYPAVPAMLAADRVRQTLGSRPRKPIWYSLAEIVTAIVKEKRNSGDLPQSRSALPVSVAALRAGAKPLAGQGIVLTEAAGPVAREIILSLRHLGAEVLAIAETDAQAQIVRAEAKASTPAASEGPGGLDVLVADLSRISGIRSAAEQIVSSQTQLTALVTLPGAPNPSRSESESDIECTFARGVLAPCMLTELLGDVLFRAPAARVVNVVDMLHVAHPLDANDLQARVAYDPLAVFGRVQSGRLLLSRLFAERATGSNVRVLSVTPGPSRAETWRVEYDRLDRVGTYQEELGGTKEEMDASFQYDQIAHQLGDPAVIAAQIVDALVGEDRAYANDSYFWRGRPVPLPPHADDRAGAENLWTLCSSIAARASRSGIETTAPKPHHT